MYFAELLKFLEVEVLFSWQGDEQESLKDLSFREKGFDF